MINTITEYIGIDKLCASKMSVIWFNMKSINSLKWIFLIDCKLYYFQNELDLIRCEINQLNEMNNCNWSQITYLPVMVTTTLYHSCMIVSFSIDRYPYGWVNWIQGYTLCYIMIDYLIQDKKQRYCEIFYVREWLKGDIIWDIDTHASVVVPIWMDSLWYMYI